MYKDARHIQTKLTKKINILMHIMVNEASDR